MPQFLSIKNFRKTIVKYAVFIIYQLFNINAASAEEKRIKKSLDEKIFLVTAIQKLSKKEIKKYSVTTTETLIGLNIKLFYTMGKMHGYIVFINNTNDYAVIDDTILFLTLSNKYIANKNKTFQLHINQKDFKNLTVARGDTIIAYPLEKIHYGDFLPQGTTVEITAECLHLTAETDVYIY